MRHVLENDLWFRDYVVAFTNVSVILKEEFRDTEDLDGLFSGWSEEDRQYVSDSWRYEGDDLGHPRRDPTFTSSLRVQGSTSLRSRYRPTVARGGLSARFCPRSRRR